MMQLSDDQERRAMELANTLIYSPDHSVADEFAKELIWLRDEIERLRAERDAALAKLEQHETTWHD